MQQPDPQKLRQLIRVCDAWNESCPDEQFGDIIQQWMEATDKPATTLAQEFERSVATINRWKSGKTTPHHKAQDIVVERLQESAELILEEFKEHHGETN